MKKSFKAKLCSSGATGPGVFILFPYDLFKLYGKRNLVKVKATFDGEPYRGSIADMGQGPCLIVLKAIREKIGKQAGDTVAVTVEQDLAPRVVTVPKELKAALAKDKPAAAFYKGLAFSHQREYSKWVGEAKQAGTRLRRAAQALEMLRTGKKLRN
jgi:hypothetical protein